MLYPKQPREFSTSLVGVCIASSFFYLSVTASLLILLHATNHWPFRLKLEPNRLFSSESSPIFFCLLHCGHQKRGGWMLCSKLQEVQSQLSCSTAHMGGSWQQTPTNIPWPTSDVGMSLMLPCWDMNCVHKLIPSQWTDCLSQKGYKWSNHKEENTDRDIMVKFHTLLHWEKRIWNCSGLKKRCYSIWFQEFKSDGGG